MTDIKFLKLIQQTVKTIVIVRPYAYIQCLLIVKFILALSVRDIFVDYSSFSMFQIRNLLFFCVYEFFFLKRKAFFYVEKNEEVCLQLSDLWENSLKGCLFEKKNK